MTFGKRLLNVNVTLQVNGHQIERVAEFKMLGVILDNLLTWKPQIASAQKKLASGVSVLWKVRNSLNHSSLRSLYYGLVAPRLYYCAEVWGQSFKTNLWPLIKLQKCSLRILHRKPYRAHTNDLFKSSGILKLNNLIDFSMLQIVYKAYRETLPNNLQLMFTLRSDAHNLRGRVKFKVNTIKSTRMQQAVSVRGVKLWNDLPLCIKQANSLREFKSAIKRRLISEY